MPFTFKDTGESYEQWLTRNRGEERQAKKCLPENKSIRRIWDMHEELTKLLEDKEVMNLGWMNSWSKDSESYYKHLISSGVKFKKVRQSSYWEYYNVEEKVVFKVDSGD